MDDKRNWKFEVLWTSGMQSEIVVDDTTINAAWRIVFDRLQLYSDLRIATICAWEVTK